MITEQAQLHGDLSESHSIVREAGKHEERQRILGELALMLIGAPKPGDVHYWLGYNEALVRLREKIETPREASAAGTELLTHARAAISECIRKGAQGEPI